MDYRKLPGGKEELSTIGIGMGNIATAADEEAEAALAYAVDHGINFFDMVCGRIGVYEAFVRVTKGRRDRVYTQMHFGAVYPKGVYEYSRDLDEIKRSFEKVLKAAGTDYTDFGYIHCIDEQSDFDKVMAKNGLFDYVRSMKEQGVVRHIGFSSHTPSIAKQFLETGEVDLFMFSINPAYDYCKGGEYAKGGFEGRTELYREAEQRGVGITVMKAFAGGQLLDEKRSPLNMALTRPQCIQYALDRPAVLSVLPGIGSVEDVKNALIYYDSTPEERDYSVLATAAPSEAMGRCVYCNHCAPCPQGIDVGLVNKYYDLAKAGDMLAKSHYEKLNVNAGACVQCGHCENRCPFHVKQPARMREIDNYFSKGEGRL